MIRAAPRSRESGALSSRSILQGLEIEIASVNSNPLCCFWRNRKARRALAGLRGGFYQGFPLVLQVTDHSCLISQAAGAFKVRKVASEVENPSRGEGVYQCASCRVDHCDGHANRLHLRKPDCW